MNRRARTDRAKKSIDSARAEVEALRSALAATEARAQAAEAKVSDAQAQIAALTLIIEKLRRALYGRRSERKERLLGQLELELDELTARAAEDDLAAETAPGAHHRGQGIRAAPAVSQALPRASAARARGGGCADLVHVLRVEAVVEGRRGRDRDAGGDSAPLEGDSDGTREVLLP